MLRRTGNRSGLERGGWVTAVGEMVRLGGEGEEGHRAGFPHLVGRVLQLKQQKQHITNHNTTQTKNTTNNQKIPNHCSYQGAESQLMDNSIPFHINHEKGFSRCCAKQNHVQTLQDVVASPPRSETLHWSINRASTSCCCSSPIMVFFQISIQVP